MTVIWKSGLGKHWDDVGLAVVCMACPAAIGEPCTEIPPALERPEGKDHFARRVKAQTHQCRREMAEAYGFVLAVPTPLFEEREE